MSAHRLARRAPRLAPLCLLPLAGALGLGFAPPALAQEEAAVDADARDAPATAETARTLREAMLAIAADDADRARLLLEALPPEASSTSNAQRLLGVALAMQGELAGAAALLRASLGRARDERDPWAELRAVAALAEVLERDAATRDEAVSTWQEAVRIAEERSTPAETEWFRARLAAIEHKQERDATAAEVRARVPGRAAPAERAEP